MEDENGASLEAFKRQEWQKDYVLHGDLWAKENPGRTGIKIENVNCY